MSLSEGQNRRAKRQKSSSGLKESSPWTSSSCRRRTNAPSCCFINPSEEHGRRGEPGPGAQGGADRPLQSRAEARTGRTLWRRGGASLQVCEEGRERADPNPGRGAELGRPRRKDERQNPRSSKWSGSGRSCRKRLPEKVSQKKNIYINIYKTEPSVYKH